MTKEELYVLLWNSGIAKNCIVMQAVMEDDFEVMGEQLIQMELYTTLKEPIQHLKNYLRLKKLSQGCFND